MAFSLYAATIPSYQQALGAVAGLLTTAETFCAEKQLAPQEIIEARLAEDMLPFAYQVKSTAVHSLGAIEGVLAGVAGENSKGDCAVRGSGDRGQCAGDARGKVIEMGRASADDGAKANDANVPAGLGKPPHHAQQLEAAGYLIDVDALIRNAMAKERVQRPLEQRFGDQPIEARDADCKSSTGRCKRSFVLSHGRPLSRREASFCFPCRTFRQPLYFESPGVR